MPKFALKLIAAYAIIITLLLKQSFAEENMAGSAIYETITSQNIWLNTERNLTPEDLKGRIILIDFWTFCCINCMHVIPDLKYLEHKFGDKLTVIGIHSAKFKNEQDTENIRSAILRYGIEHPVVNDFNFAIWQRFGVRSWPTFVLIDPNGHVAEAYSGEGNREAVEDDVNELIKKFSGKIVTSKLPIALEKDKTPPTVLSFPGKITPSENGMFVSDSGHHRILELSTDGKILTEIGSGTEGFKDGDFKTAQFRRPQGVLYKDGKLYIADTENHSIRLADLKTKTVSTIAGNGTQGYNRTASNDNALKTEMASPWDLAFYPDDKHIAIAMAGTHQLWSYDIDKKTVSVIAGNGRESIDDGRYPFNSLSQPSGVSPNGGKLYFVDSETSSLRYFENGKIETLIGTGLFDFGYKEGNQESALMQHSLGLYADGDDIYIADSYNHSLRRYNIKEKYLHNFAGSGQRGNSIGKLSDVKFNEPADIEKIGAKFYITDTNNNRIDVLDPLKGEVSVLNVAVSADYSIDDNLPNKEEIGTLKIKSGAEIKLNMKKGWKINNDAPSYLAIFDGEKPIASFEKDELKKLSVKLPTLSDGKKYRLQGTLYYCEDKEGSECLIKSFDGNIIKGNLSIISLDL